MNQIINNILPLKDFFEIIQSIMTTVAIIVGGFWSYRLFWLRRQRYPRALIKHEVNHTELTHRSVLLNVSVEISNIGDVVLRIKKGVLWVQQILPLPHSILKTIAENKNLKEEIKIIIPDEDRYFWNTEIPWPLIESSENEWVTGDIDIEPGGNKTIRYDFIIGNHIKVVRIYTFFEDSFKRPVKWSPTADGKIWHRSHKRKKYDRVGWDLSTMHHINLEIKNNKQPDGLEGFL